MIHLIGHFKDLEPGSTYEIRCSLRFANVTIHSDWEITETECIRKSIFILYDIYAFFDHL